MIFKKQLGELKILLSERAVVAGQLTKTAVGNSDLCRTISNNEFDTGPVTGILEKIRSSPALLFDGVKKTLIEHQEFLEKLRMYSEYAFDFAERMLVSYLDYIGLTGRVESIYFERKEMYKTMIRWYYLQFLGELTDFLKFQTCYLFAYTAGNMTPPIPELSITLGRVGYLFGNCQLSRELLFLSRRNILRKKWLGFFFGLQEVKKASLPIHPVFVKETEIKTYKWLTEDHSDDFSVLPEQVLACIRLTSELCRRRKKEVREKIFGNELPRFRDYTFPNFPRSASYNTTRKDGGVRSIIEDRDDVSEMRITNFLSPYLFCMMHSERTGTVEVRGYGDPDFRNNWDSEIVRYGNFGKIYSKLIGLPEPFKVRVISKGEEEPYLICRGYQKLFWGLLKQSSIFRLTGRPVIEADVRDLINFHSWSGRWINSGDYKAATDNFHPILTRTVVETIIDEFDLPDEHRYVLLNGLIGHKIVNPEDQGEDPVGVDQKWGQLMGSPISFVILCIVNAACNIEFLTPGHMIVPKKDEGPVPMLINGDDILVGCDPTRYSDWFEFMTHAGLKPSIGKNFISTKFGIINSTMFKLPFSWQYPNEEVYQPVERIKTCRIHLTYPPYQVRKLDSIFDRIDKDMDLGAENDIYRTGRSLAARFEELIDFPASEECIDRLMKLGIRRHMEMLKKLPPNLSWCSSRKYGGLGLPLTRQGTISTGHLQFASYLECLDPEKLKKWQRDTVIPSETGTLADQFASVLKTPINKLFGVEVMEYGPWNECKVRLPEFLTYSLDDRDREGTCRLRVIQWGRSLSKGLRKASGTSLGIMSEERVSRSVLIRPRFVAYRDVISRKSEYEDRLTAEEELVVRETDYELDSWDPSVISQYVRHQNRNHLEFSLGAVGYTSTGLLVRDSEFLEKLNIIDGID